MIVGIHDGRIAWGRLYLCARPAVPGLDANRIHTS